MTELEVRMNQLERANAELKREVTQVEASVSLLTGLLENISQTTKLTAEMIKGKE